MSNHFIGLISGTSVDGVDAVAARFSDGRCEIVGARTTPFPADLHVRINQAITTQRVSLRELGGLDVALGRFFAHCVEELLRETGIDRGAVEAIGHHGQTVYHEPDGTEPFTMQLGDPSSVAALTGITTVADFRRLDMAYGGQGAPLVPAFHDWLLRNAGATRVITNIGGIGNVTVLAPGRATMGFDTGPGNTLLDDWIGRQRGAPYDDNGGWASSGRVEPELLLQFLREPYFGREPPKSTGRELFNRRWLDTHLATITRAVEPADVQATLAELTAVTIVQALDRLGLHGYELVVCGGGARNGDLLDRLRRLSGQVVTTTDQHGIAAEWIEAAAFAWLAFARLRGIAGNVPTVTGARQSAILGGVYYGGTPETISQQYQTCGHAESQTA
jgi:anhydro-N-acetylmuramic acid kinase